MKYTESIKDHEITDVIYTDKSKQDVLIAWTHKETKKISLDCISADLEHPDFQDVVSKIMTEEEIWINSVNKWKAEQKAQDEKLLKIAKEKGYFSTEPVSVLQNLLELSENTESLFKLKLEIFELGQVQKSKNRTWKTSMRKAKTALELLALLYQELPDLKNEQVEPLG